MEQINLSSSEEENPFEEQLAVDKINRQFRQESRLKGIIREFSIFNDSHLHQMLKKKHRGKSEFHINLALVDATPEHEFVLAYDWLITTIICSLATLLIVYVCWFSSMQISSSTASILTAFSVTFCAIIFLITLLKTDNRVQLFSRYGHVPIIEFINNKPSRSALSEFIKILQQHIESAQQSTDLSAKELLSLELKELRRLHKEAITSLAHYEQAKKQIFSNRAFKSHSG